MVKLCDVRTEQRRSGDALDTVALYIENAARAGASTEVSGYVSLSASMYLIRCGSGKLMWYAA